MIAQRWTIRGRVQGVGYRESMRLAARRAGVHGYVRNRTDGTVEAFVQGETEALARLRAWCERGPPAARVTGIDVEETVADPQCQGFMRAPTRT